ncbi:MAG: tRNA lysidine(34) synthetase TilS [Sphaerochaeta sp.]
MPTTDVSVLSEVARFLDEHRVDRAKKFAVAFSGGSDSLSLLIALSSLVAKDLLYPLYVNHRIRSTEELNSEIELNRVNCQKLGLPLTVLDLQQGQVTQTSLHRRCGIEEAARTLRYEALFEACANIGCAYLATAHNADDQMETVLTRVFQGSSIASIGGIEPLRSDFTHHTIVVRPVLLLSHRQLQVFVQQQGFFWSEDSTNKDDGFQRNAIRHTISPAIHAQFPQAYAALARLNLRAHEIAALLDRMTEQALGKVDFGSDAGMALESFHALEPAIRDNVLFKMYNHIEKSRGSRLRYASVQRVRNQLEVSTEQSRWIIHSGGTVVQLSQGYFSWSLEAVPYNFCISMGKDFSAKEIDLENGVVFSVVPGTVESDVRKLRIEAGLLVNPVLRSPLHGDKIELQGKTVLLSKLFSEWKIPAELQLCIPVLEDVHGIVAVFGDFLGGRDRLCNRYKTPLVGRVTNIYSVNKRNGSSEIQKR